MNACLRPPGAPPPPACAPSTSGRGTAAARMAPLPRRAPFLRSTTAVTRAAPPSAPKERSPPRPRSPPPPLASLDENSDDAVVLNSSRFWDWNSWTNRGKGLVLLNVLVLLCASNWVIVKEAEAASADPEVFTALRFGVAALAFTPWLKKGLSEKGIVIAGLELGLWSALGYLTQAEGLLTTDASRASFLSTFSVVTVPVLAGLDGNRISLTTWGCAAAAILGVYFLENGGAPPSWGDAWSLASAVCFAIQIYRTEARTKVVPEDRVLPLLAVIVAVVALITCGAASARDPTALPRLAAAGPEGVKEALSAVDWVPIFWTGLMSTDAVLLLELVALRWVSSVDAAIVYTTEPVLGGVIAWCVLGERFGPKGFLGAAIIVVAALTTQLVGTGGGEEGK